MNKHDYLFKLKFLLNDLSEKDRNEILYDIEEHFNIGTQAGKSEEEIAASLGDVRNIAKQYKADYTIRAAEQNTSAGNIFRAVLATVALGFFNLVFILGPFLGLVGVMIGLFAASFGMSIGGFCSILAVLLHPLFPAYFNMNMDSTFAIFISIFLTSLGVLFFIGNCYLARWFYKGTIRYLKWNIETIKK